MNKMDTVDEFFIEHVFDDGILFFKPRLVWYVDADVCDCCGLPLSEHNWIVLDCNRKGVIDCEELHPKYYCVTYPDRLDMEIPTATLFSMMFANPGGFYEFSFNGANPREIWVRLKPAYDYRHHLVSNMDTNWDFADKWRPVE